MSYNTNSEVSLRASISMHEELEKELLGNIENLKETDDLIECQSILARSQVQFILFNVQNMRRDKELQLEYLEHPIVPNAPTINAPAIGVAYTRWKCSECGATGEIAHSPFSISLADFAGIHKCDKLSNEFIKISIVLSNAVEFSEDLAEPKGASLTMEMPTLQPTEWNDFKELQSRKEHYEDMILNINDYIDKWWRGIVSKYSLSEKKVYRVSADGVVTELESE